MRVKQFEHLFVPRFKVVAVSAHARATAADRGPFAGGYMSDGKRSACIGLLALLQPPLNLCGNLVVDELLLAARKQHKRTLWVID